MSKMSQEVMQGQQVAEQFYSLPREKFVSVALETLGASTPSFNAAIDAFDDIRSELGDYYASTAEDFVPAIIDEDGIPF